MRQKKKEIIHVLQDNLRSRLAALRRAEHLRKKKNREYVRTVFLSLLKDYLSRRKEGSLKQQC